MTRRLTVPLISLLLIGLCHISGLLEGLGSDGLDLLFRLRGPRPPDQRIVIVGIDEPSLNQLGAWPFPRRLHADLLGHLRQAKAIGFDLLFPEPTADDARFSEALRSSPPVILAVTHDHTGRILLPADAITGHAGTGHIETILSGDGIVRGVHLDSVSPLPALSLALLKAAAIDIPPIVDEARMLLNFYGPEDTFLFLAYADVLAGRYLPDFFKDRLVLIGAQAVGLGDSHITSFTRQRATPGVEIQATILNNLLDRSFIRPLPLLSWACIVLICLLAATVWPRSSERVNLALNAALLLMIVAAAWLLFRQALFFDFPQVLLFLLLAYSTHLIQQLLHAAYRIFEEARRIDRELDVGLHLVAGTIPTTCLEGGAAASPPLAASGIQRHLDRLQAATNALRLQHHFLDNLLKEELPPLILWEEGSGTVVFANTAFRSFWEAFAPEDRTLPNLQPFLDAVTEPMRHKNFHSDGNTSNEGVIGIELLGIAGRRYYQANLHPLLAPATGFRGRLAVLQDITDIKELERLKDEVVAIVSHELKLPLTTILGYAEMLSDTLDGAERTYASEICGQSRRLNRMIEDFLDIARLESGRQQVRRFPFPLDRMLEDAVAAVSPKANEKGISLNLHQPSRTTPFVGDESLLLQAVINLLDNAVKFSPKGSVVDLVLEERIEDYYIRVTDQGPGIAAEDRQRVFEKFQRLDHPQQEGFGLGLHLVKQIVDRHHGSIALVDADQGAIFAIRLPKVATPTCELAAMTKS